jgi:hypothetical protein
MEGGWLTWKQQKIECTSPDLDSYGKPLPPPPSGWFWERQNDGSWILVKYVDRSDGEGTVQFNQHGMIEHTVMSDDTLQGLCLRYRVSATDLRRSNIFSGSSFQFKKTLRIPIAPGSIVQPQVDTQEVKVQKFKNVTGEGNQEAHLYLENSDWDVDRAIGAWKGDENWTITAPRSQVAFSSEVSEPIVAPLEVQLVHEVRPLFVTDAYPVHILPNGMDPAAESLLFKEP